jgi:hypothetical protein
VGKRFGDVIVVNKVLHGGVMVLAGISYGQRTQLHFIDGNLNAQRYRGEILRPIFMSNICLHHLMFQHDNAQPNVARICTQFLEVSGLRIRLRCRQFESQMFIKQGAGKRQVKGRQRSFIQGNVSKVQKGRQA